MPFDHPEFDRHERVCHIDDARTGLRAIIAIHRSREMGAAGGVRFRPYSSGDEALCDVLRLSKAMTYKNVLAGLPVGGGKSVILGDPAHDKTPSLLRAFGRVVDGMGGAYLCGPDVGTSPDDMDVIATETSHVGGTNRQMGSSGPPTAEGVFRALLALARHLGATNGVSGLHVAIQGAGAVGGHLAGLLAAAGARVSVADPDYFRARAVAERTGAEVVSPEEVLTLEADILSPCALGGVISEATLPGLRVRGVCGGANNQLATEDDGRRLQARGIAFVPDFVASGGGIIAGMAASGLYPSDEMQPRLDSIHDRALEILRRADATGETPNAVAHAMAHEILKIDSERVNPPIV